jgi:predicted ribosome quality control (RQC) complex YloA/Tae2 family protein
LSLNWKEIDLVLRELQLPGMQIQKVYQSSYDVLVLQVYGRPYNSGEQEPARARLILISISPLSCRIHESFRAAPKSEKPLRFAEFLKSRIINGRIEEAVQLGDNRIVRITVQRGEHRWRIYVRLWSNAANVIVTGEDGIILDAMRRLPKRKETGGFSYEPEKPPASASGVKYAGGVEHAGGAGQGPAKEYQVRDLPGSGSFNSRVDDWYAEHGGKLSLEQLREELQRSIGKNMNRLEAALERLREKEADYGRAERFKEYGDLILANSAKQVGDAAMGAGASWLEAERFPAAAEEREGTGGDVDAAEPSPPDLVRIELDPRKNPAQNAAGYYEKYRKAKNGLGELREDIAAGERELALLHEAETTLLQETNPLRLEALLKKMRRGLPASGGASAKKRPGLSFADGDWLILVGRDARENDELLRRHVKGSDLWLHTRDWAGSYVFIKHRPGKSIPLDILLDAGNLALFYSKGRNNRRGDLYYTQVKYLRRAKNGPKGLVIPTQEKNLQITLDQNRLKKLEDLKL